MPQRTLNPYLLFIFFALGIVLICRGPLAALWRLSLSNEHYSQILVVPIMSASLLYFERKLIFSKLSFGPALGAALLLAGVALMALARSLSFNAQIVLALEILALVVGCWGLFALCFGHRSLQRSAVPMAFLLFMVPLPERLLDQVIFFLQGGSAVATSFFFRLFGVPFLQDGLTFVIPGIQIVIAHECSGIRSSVALLLTMLLAGHLFLRSRWHCALLLLAVVPVAVIKNGLRIAVISWLGLNVNRAFFTGHLHRDGGILFFLFGLAILLALVALLRRREAVSALAPQPASHLPKNIPEAEPRRPMLPSGTNHLS